MPLNVDRNLPFSDENPRLTRFEHFQSGFCEQVCCARAQASTPGLARSALDDDNGDNGVFLTRSLLLVAMRKMMMIL